MSLDQIELALATHGIGTWLLREDTILLKGLLPQKPSNSSAESQGQTKSTLHDGFTLFPKLPPELRCKIWEHALPGSQIIEFYCYQRFNSNPDILEAAASSQRPLVRLIKTCKEPSEVVKGHYRSISPRAFGVRRLPPTALFRVHPAHDVIRISG